MAEQGTNETIIGADTIVKGEMMVESRARILGTVEGTIKAKGQIEIANNGKCKASVDAGVLQVNGSIEGNVTATEKVELSASARLVGDLVAPKLVVAEGAAFKGHVNVGPDAVKGAAVTRPRPPAPEEPTQGQKK